VDSDTNPDPGLYFPQKLMFLCEKGKKNFGTGSKGGSGSGSKDIKNVDPERLQNEDLMRIRIRNRASNNIVIVLLASKCQPKIEQYRTDMYTEG